MRRLQLFALAAALLGASACGRPALPAPATPRQLEVAEGQAFQPAGGNAVTLLVDGERIFAEIDAVIRKARRTVQVHIFQLGGDTGMRIVEALAERQAAGVKVQVLLDPNRGGGGSGKQQIMRCVAALDRAGIPWKDYDLRAMPKGPTWLSRLGVIDHSKLVVVDGETAIMGGMNFYDHAVPNHDYMLRIEGPAATQLGELMNLDWRHSGGEGVLELPKAAPRGDAIVRLAETSPRTRSIRSLLVDRFKSARSKIYTQVLFLDDDRVVEALVGAKARGVDVRVMLDPIQWGNHVPELDKLPFDGIPNWAAVEKLLRGKVQVAWFVPDRPQRNLHAKISMVDDRWVLTGSANYTYRALDRNRELAAEAEAPEAAAAFAEVFERDMRAARLVTSLTPFQRRLAALFDRVKRGIYDEKRDLPSQEPDVPVPTLAVGG